MTDAGNVSSSHGEEAAEARPEQEPGPGQPDEQARALQDMLAAREEWHRARGELPPPSTAAQAPDGDAAPADARLIAAERRFIQAREAWHRQQSAGRPAD